MRKIKFRVFHKVDLKMYEVTNINFEDRCVDVKEIEDYGLHFNIIELMQYTGFNDSNGTEIYEGDIVKIVKGVGENLGQSNVFYGNIGELQPMSYLNDYNFNNYEVIGNIYENPEIINYI